MERRHDNPSLYLSPYPTSHRETRPPIIQSDPTPMCSTQISLQNPSPYEPNLTALTRDSTMEIDESYPNVVEQPNDDHLLLVDVIQEEVDKQHLCDNFSSPRKLIKEWVPSCSEALLPKVGMIFDDLEHCVKFYKTYAHHVGFVVRKSNGKKGKEGIVLFKYYVCSREGFKEKSTSSKYKWGGKIRQRKLTREGCEAMVGFKRIKDGKYILYRFHDGHTHLLSTPKKRHMLKSNSSVKSVHRALFKSYTCANVGPSKAHRFMKEQAGSFEHVGCSKEALKNFQRDLKAYISGSDAHMFIENLKSRKEVNKSFYFAYVLDDNKSLKHVFWADGVSRRNYAMFGDVVSFDTTYDTNRYKMIFAPFTGLDNHRLCVTFGVAFLGDEKAESFKWLFESFLDAMGGRKPVCIITDQDPAMKLAIPQVFDTTTHRFCLWHIMRKLSEKVGVALNSNNDFNTRFKSCVYNSETPVEFETSWQCIMEDFGLINNDWLSHMFVLREMWIPAYFMDLFLGAVLRTTSRSESENSFFSNFTNPHVSLVEFWMRFVSAIDLQRHNQLKKDHDCLSSMPELKSERNLEKHAAKIFTYPNFYIFQHELWVGTWECEIEEKREIPEGLLIVIVDNSKKGGKMRQVIYNPLDHVAHCSCKMFECEGIPCRHILCIVKGKLNELPNYYILNRWTKMASSKPTFDVDGNFLGGCSQMNCEDNLISDNWREFINCLEVAGRDPQLLALALKGISNVTEQLVGLKSSSSESKEQQLESFIGSRAPEQVEIFPPRQSNTKGSGKRLKGGKEVAIEQQKKRRVCKACGEETNHDSRNCPSKVPN